MSKALSKIIAKVEETFPDARWLLRSDGRTKDGTSRYFANVIFGNDTPMVTIDRDGRQSVNTTNRYYPQHGRTAELALLNAFVAARQGERALTEACETFVEGSARG